MEENILNILLDVNADAEWDNYLDEIENGMENYQKAPGRGEDPEKYLTPILPKYWEVFHTHNIYRRCNRSLLCPIYDVGIFLVGFSTIPIVLSLAEIQPTEEVYFLYSRETEPMLQEISKRISKVPQRSSLTALVSCSITCPDHALEINRSSDPVQTFKRIKEVIDKVGDKRIALDLTGGKKTMLGGGFTAGSILSVEGSESLSACDMFYVDSLEYDPDSRAPKPGREFLSRLANPYDVYNVQNVQEAEELFRNHNYEAAVSLWRSVSTNLKNYAKQYGLEKEQEKVRKNLNMANCYRFWNALDYGKAQDHKSSWAYNKWHTQGELDVLNILYEVAGRRMLFDLGNKARVIHYAIDRYQNGIRAQASDKLDDAMVRFTQVIEMLCIYKICQIASTSNLIENATHLHLHETWCADKSWRISSLINFLFGKSSDYDSEYKISDCSKLLQEVDYVPVSDIIELIQPRNDFIHFTRRATRDHTAWNTNQLKELAKLFLENFSQAYCCEQGLSFNDLLKLHEFRQL